MGAPVVIDNGSNRWKVGFSGEYFPIVSFPPVIGISKYDAINCDPFRGQMPVGE